MPYFHITICVHSGRVLLMSTALQVDQLTEEMNHKQIDYETRVALEREKYEGQKSTLIKEHQTRTSMTVEDFEKRVAIYEDALAKANAATQARVAEIGRITLAADEAASLATRRQSQLELEVAEAKAQIGRLDFDLNQTRKNAKQAAEEQSKVGQG